jgi:hypothetical protein
VIAPRIAPLQDAVRAANEAPARIVGSAANAVAAGLTRQPILVDERRAPDIAWVARLGAAADETAPAKPLYLSAADAQPQTASQLPRR